jgi:hypothetical protein
MQLEEQHEFTSGLHPHWATEVNDMEYHGKRGKVYCHWRLVRTGAITNPIWKLASRAARSLKADAHACLRRAS